ncbi:GAF and ANTAR domain-containing protein [Nocardioides cavernae]|uniref:GAF and ANTAR domain-containing protein n=1 Tax=Nocardioides cavernae TaxID=1921566 RepID=A0ABR8NBY0_9ACTN|nr:GAF and ANTAR domain-containing protein [Nocardioides cavernae]MBD3925632.1 GAF and ANTAR domain-containing protein [Nocardioides cavernae]MBM7513987.1 transcriptional regulator with GAF, ATPase, and Fis domain [Nocardioides cavernae]
MDRHEFGRRLAEAARGMSEARHPADTLQRIATMAVELIDACDVAGVCVLRSGRNDTCAHTHASLQVMDDLQHDLAEGPAMGGPPIADVVSVGDLSTDAPWPRWGSEVVDRTGVRAYLGFRLFVEGDSIGMLNLYAYEPDAFDHEDKLDGLVAAAHASVALSATVRHDQMHTALTSRQLIGEATGILRERFALTSDQAFAVLKRLSSEQNIKLFAVAQQVVETGTLPGSAS